MIKVIGWERISSLWIGSMNFGTEAVFVLGENGFRKSFSVK